jgi:hypothetical protein
MPMITREEQLRRQVPYTKEEQDRRRAKSREDLTGTALGATKAGLGGLMDILGAQGDISTVLMPQDIRQNMIPSDHLPGGSEWWRQQLINAGVFDPRAPSTAETVGTLIPGAANLAGLGGAAVKAGKGVVKGILSMSDEALANAGRVAGRMIPLPQAPLALGAAPKGPKLPPQGPPAAPSPPTNPAAQAPMAPPVPPITKSTNLPDIRPLPTADSIRIARTEPHLIPSPVSSEGGFVGSPRNIKTKADVEAQRRYLDEYVARDARGGDWYDRQRAAIAEVTGFDPRYPDIGGGIPKKHADWMAAQEGQNSAGVSPETELLFGLRPSIGDIVGLPQGGHYPAQDAAQRAAIAANDWSKYQLAEKTDEYRRFSNPNQPRPPGATGVNDFRHAVNLGYTEPSGIPQKAGLTKGQHTWSDYETALMVDRANKAKLGGRSNWTGEQIQAAPWVVQKADAIFEKSGQGWMEKYMKDGLSVTEARAKAYEDAFQEGNKTIGDFLDKHTMNITSEKMVGSKVAARGHLPGSANWSDAERRAYSLDYDPRAMAPGFRDPIYSGMQAGDSGVAMRVRPSIQNQGMYKAQGEPVAFEEGLVHRPLAAFDVGPGGTKSLTDADKLMFNTGELWRALVGGQNAAAGHIVWRGGRTKDMNAVAIPTAGRSTPDELLGVKSVSDLYGMPDVVDRGKGLTLMNPAGDAPDLKDKTFRSLVDTLDPHGVLRQEGGIERVKADTIYRDVGDYRPVGKDYNVDWSQPGVNLWEKPGEGHATRAFLNEVNTTPQLRAAFEQNPYIAGDALAQHGRDVRWADKGGGTSSDLQHLREVAGTGKGWIKLLESMYDPVTGKLKPGMNLPGFAGAGLLGYGLWPGDEEAGN